MLTRRSFVLHSALGAAVPLALREPDDRKPRDETVPPLLAVEAYTLLLTRSQPVEVVARAHGTMTSRPNGPPDGCVVVVESPTRGVLHCRSLVFAQPEWQWLLQTLPREPATAKVGTLSSKRPLYHLADASFLSYGGVRYSTIVHPDGTREKDPAFITVLDLRVAGTLAG